MNKKKVKKPMKKLKIENNVLRRIKKEKAPQRSIKNFNGQEIGFTNG